MPKKSDKSSDKKFLLAEQLQSLQTLVEKMESSELPLEESLSCFEEGIALIRECQKKLTDAEQKVLKLTQKNGSETLVPFETDEDEA